MSQHSHHYRSTTSESVLATVGFVGALVKRKGAHTLVRAFGLLENKAKLIIVGDGPERQNLEVLARESANEIVFLGNSNHVSNDMFSMDMLVVPSEAFESFGMVILEGMAAGLPVIASDCGGMKEIVLDEVTGLIFPSGDAAKLSEAISRLVRSPEERLKFGMNGHQRLLNHYSRSDMNNRYVALVSQLLNSKS
jgi:glycosyltransferase involved in cell wall biosynthesis